MDELNRLIDNLIKEKGGSRNDYLTFLNSIAYHETGRTMDPTTKQIGGGPGRGLYQMESGKHSGAITAAKRTKQYLESLKEEVPDWLYNISQKDDLDASTLSPDKQSMLALGTLRMHPKADLKDVVTGKQSIPEFWANYHWAGPSKDRNKRIKSFTKDYEHLQEVAPMFFEEYTPVGHDKINQFKKGGNTGPGDPPKKKKKDYIEGAMEGDDYGREGLEKREKLYADEKSFVENWMKNPITMQKLIDKRGEDATKTYWDVVNKLNHLDNTGHREEQFDGQTRAYYQPQKNTVTTGLRYNEGPFVGASTHEYSHALGLDKELSRYAQKDVGYLKLTNDDLPSDRAYKQYLNRGEVWPRIMSIRYRLGLKPGDNVTKDDLKDFTGKDDDLFKFYSKEQIKDLLNKSVDANTPSTANWTALGGVLGGGSKIVDRELNSFNTGGLHHQNPHGGIPIGMGGNGKMNTVEQGETSYPAGDGKFIFSNRLYLK